MKKLLALTAGAFVAATAFAADADAWERRSTVTGPAGNSVHIQGQGSCYGSECSRTKTYTGPAGNKVHVQGGIQGTAPGQWERGRTITGSAGNTATLGATGSCYGGECQIERQRTGPAGNTVRRSTTIRAY